MKAKRSPTDSTCPCYQTLQGQDDQDPLQRQGGRGGTRVVASLFLKINKYQSSALTVVVISQVGYHMATDRQSADYQVREETA